MDGYEATATKFTDSYYAANTDSENGIQRLCLQKGETLEIEMSASERITREDRDFFARVEVDGTTVAEARTKGIRSHYLLHRFTAEDDDTDVKLEFEINNRTFDPTWVHFGAKIYKNVPG